MFLSLATLFDGYPLWFGVTVAIVFVIVIAYLAAQLAARATHFLACRALGVDVHHRFRHLPAAPVRLVRGVVFLLIAVVLIFPALEIVGVRTELGVRPQALGRWLMQSGLRIGLIVLVSYLILKIVGMIAQRLESEVEAAGGTDAMERLKRVRTVRTLAQNALGALVTGIALLMVLRELNLDITPILTGAGIVGLAVGFGAQTLVKDVISGFFLILENQVRVGDVAAINGTGGLVEAITLRTIVLRDQAGTVHVFPNGSITTLSNMSKDFAYYVIDLGVAYDEDTDRVTRVLRSIDEELRADVVFGPSILEPVEVLGIENFAESQITMRLRIKTLPLKQWDVGRELRRRIKIRFAAEGIVIPVRQLKLHVDDSEALRGATAGPREPARTGQE